MNKLIKKLSIIVFLLISGLSSYLLLNNKEMSLRFDDFNRLSMISECEVITYNNLNSELYNLPKEVEASKPFTVIYDVGKIEKYSEKSVFLTIRYSAARCFMDGKEIYSYEPNSDSLIKSGGTSLHIIDIPKDSKSSQFIVQFYPRMTNLTHYKVSPIAVDYRSHIVANLLPTDLIQLILCIVLLVMFFISTLISILDFNNLMKNKIVHIGFLSLLLSSYFLVQLNTINYFFYQYHSLFSMIEFTSLMLITLPISQLLVGRVDPMFNPFLSIVKAITVANVCIQYFCLFYDYGEFRVYLILSHIVLLFSAILICSSLLFTDGKKYATKKFLVLSIAPLLIAFTISILLYFFTKTLLFGLTLLLFMSIFILVQLAGAMISYTSTKEETIKNIAYKEMAYTDAMTGLNNRAAYNDYISKLSNNNFWVILLDLNRLKVINDTKGHLYGDRIITLFSKAILQCIEQYSFASSFRTGGDEFVIFFKTDNNFDMDYFMEQFRDKVHCLTEEEKLIPITFSVGITYYDGLHSTTIDDVLSKVDKLMYEDKENYK